MGPLVTRYRSQVSQSLHYFARPHDGVRRTPIRSEAAWRGSDFSDESSYVSVLDEDDRREIVDAVERWTRKGRPLADARESDFPLPRLAPRIREYRRAVRSGRGFQIVRGVPIDELGERGSEVFFWCFGLHLGTPGAQNPAGDLLGHVRDTGAPGDGSVRQYRTREGIDFHCDLADVVGLLCLTPARSGGRSRIVSSVTAYNELLSRRPDLVDRLYEPFPMDTKGEAGVPWVPVVPCAHARGELRTFWHAGYFRSFERYERAPDLDDRAREVLDLYAAIMNEPGTALELEFRPGDIQLLSNHTITHGRTAFVDGETPETRRHLLRLWLSLDEHHGLRTRLSRERSRAVVLARLVRARVAAKVGLI